MPGEAEVVEARETDHVAAADAGDAVLHPLVGEEEGIVEAGRFEAAEPLFERDALGEHVAPMILEALLLLELLDRMPLVALGRRVMWQPCGGPLLICAVEHASGDALDQVADRDDSLEPLLAKPHLVAALDPVDCIQEADRAHARLSQGHARGEGPPRRRLAEGKFLEHEAGDGQS